jgi:hypothetical protein
MEIACLGLGIAYIANGKHKSSAPRMRAKAY